MNDVFDEDLMRELGLDPDEIEAVKKPAAPAPKPAAPKPAAPQPKAPEPQAARPAAPQPPKAPAQQPPAAKAPAAPQAPSASSGQGAPAAKAPARPAPSTGSGQAVKPIEKVEEDFAGYGEKMTQTIPVHLAAVLAKKSIALKDVIEMRTGEVIDFKKPPQEPIDLVVNGKLVAKAELVLVDGRIGARIVKLVR